MSLADDWDSISAADAKPAAPARAAAPSGSAASLADDWDSIRPSEAKPQPTVESKVGEGARKVGEAIMTPAEFVGNQVSGIGAQILGGYRGLATIASGGSLADAADAVHSTAERGTYHPPEGSVGASMVQDSQSPFNPMNWPGIIAGKAGQATMDVTGSPAAAAAVETGINAVPLLLIKGGKGEKAAPRPEPKLVGSSSLADVAKPAQVTSEPNYDVPTVLRRQQAAVEAATVPGRPAVVQPAGEPPVAIEAPQGPKFAETVPAAEPGSKLALPDQLQRAQILQRVGIEDARKSAIEGDRQAAADDFQTSKLNNGAGTLLKTTLDNERAALTNHAEQIVRDTGGSLGTDAQSLEARGNAIVGPLESFRQWFTDKTAGLYTEARARAQGTPLALDRFQGVLDTDSKFANTDTIELRKGIQSRMRELGMIDKDGDALPATVDQAEALRQYVNEEWTPKANGRIRELKNALDDDVTSAAGDDVFRQARALHAMKMSIFEDPKGLSSILDSEGINRKVPIERIPDTIAALPNAQFAHIVKTLQTVPPELAPQAQAALGEIKAQFANRMRDAGVGPNGQPVLGGQWRARDVTTYLNKNAAKMELVFSPDELAKVRDLNDAGHILAKDASYPGAAVQAHNLMGRGVMRALPAVGATAGGTIGALFGAPGTGALVGEGIGASAASKFGNAAELRAAQKRVVKLSDFLK